MDDLKTEFKLSQIAPDVAEKWLKVRNLMLKQTGHQIKVTDGYRNFQDQKEVWQKGRTLNSSGFWVISQPKLVVTHALPGQSLHQYGLALDSAFFGEDPYLDKLPKKDAEELWAHYGRLVKDQGMRWGGDWVGIKCDRPHCEMTYGLSLHTIQMTYESLGMQRLWSKCADMYKIGGQIV